MASRHSRVALLLVCTMVAGVAHGQGTIPLTRGVQYVGSELNISAAATSPQALTITLLSSINVATGQPAFGTYCTLLGLPNTTLVSNGSTTGTAGSAQFGPAGTSNASSDSLVGAVQYQPLYINAEVGSSLIVTLQGRLQGANGTADTPGVVNVANLNGAINSTLAAPNTTQGPLTVFNAPTLSGTRFVDLYSSLDYTPTAPGQFGFVTGGQGNAAGTSGCTYNLTFNSYPAGSLTADIA